MTIAFYNNTFDKAFSLASPENVILAIANGEWMQQVQYLRSLNKTEYDAEKKKLPAVTWSGSFKPGTRSIETIDRYSQLVVIDVDKLDSDKITLYKTQLAQDEYVRYCFVSPSGTGIKFVIQVNSGPGDHRAAFLHLQDYFEKKYFFKVDGSGKDVSRLCYVSWDPQTIIKKSKVFEVDLKFGEIITNTSPINLDNMKAVHDSKAIYDVCVKWVERNKAYRDGEKNIYIHALACALNRTGVAMDIAIALIDQNIPTPDKVWYQSVRSAYFHNQHEHNTKQVREIGASDFIAPAYVISYTDAAISELATYTAMLFQKGVPKTSIEDLIVKLAKYYDSQGWIDGRRTNIYDVMNYAVQALNQNIANQTSQHALSYQNAEDVAYEIIGQDMSRALPVYLSWFDMALGGGLMPGNFYGLIGFGGTFKSVLILYMAYMDALNGIPSLYVNSEMSRMQYLERVALITLGVNMRYQVSQGTLNKDTVNDFAEQIKAVTNNNMQVYNGQGYTKQAILSTLEHYTATTGKKIQRIYMDGLAQMDWGGLEEIGANIKNSFICKDIAKEANGGEGAALIALIHCSGEENKAIRNTGIRVRGGSKLLSNMDGYFCTSLLIDPESLSEENPDEFSFIPGRFHLRMIDKRSTAGEVSAVINVTKNLHLEIEEHTDPRSIEVKLNKKPQR